MKNKHLSQTIEGFSLGLYSTWFLYRPNKILFDCGEGISIKLRGKISAIKHIFLSHGHSDHIDGLPGLINIWNLQGKSKNSLNIYYPYEDYSIKQLQNYIIRRRPDIPESALNWISVKAGESITIESNKKLEVVAFATEHIKDVLTLGYHLVETRSKLKSEYSNIAKKEIESLAKQGKREELLIERKHKILTYVGDTVLLSFEEYSDTELLMHEATHLERGVGHTTLEEIISLAAKIQPKRLLLYHFSTRYSQREIVGAAKTLREKYNISFPVWMQYQSNLEQI